MHPNRPGLPYANSAIAVFLDQRIDALRGVKTQREIAAAAGYDRPNIISMFKRGETKIPLEKIPALAKAVEADAAHMFRLAMEAQWPELVTTIAETFGRQMASNNEVEIFLEKWRAATGNADPAPSDQIMEAVDRMVANLFGLRRREDGS
jgi:hypothetical protein